jgi:Fe-S cluster biogenesis protein NfuA
MKMDLTEKIEFFEKVSKSIEEVRPFLQDDGGDIELVNVLDDYTVEVKLLGACGTCPTSIYTLKEGIEKYLQKEIPQVKEVVRINDY